MKTVSCHRKYPITTNFLDTMLEHSVDIQEGESKLDAYRRGLKELDQIASELRKEANPHLYQESTPHAGIDSNGAVKSITITNPGPYGGVSEINLNDQRQEIFDTINQCTTIEELKAWKSHNQTIPGKILTHYNNRLQQLTK